ncbi:MAG: type II secretion system F family protein [Methanomassiliicoccales archaeon]
MAVAFKLGLRQKLAYKLNAGLRDSKMEPKRYFTLVLIAIVTCGLIIPGIINYVLSDYLTGIASYTIYAIPIFMIFVVAIFPIMASSKKKVVVERIMPLFVTEMAALSTSEMPIDKIFYVLSTRSEHGPLAEDSKKIFRLIHHYHVSAADACRFVAARTPSILEQDFLNRLAHALEVGERLDRFMKNEHDVIMDEYVLKCESVLKDLDFVKELFTGIITSLIFICVFISIVPLLGAQSTDAFLFGIVMTFAAMEGMFVYYIYSKVPKDEIWYPWRSKWRGKLVKDHDRVLFISVLVAIAGTISLSILLIPLGLPNMLLASSVFLPFLIPGILIWREERRIEKRDNIYGAFIRSLGRSCSVSGQTMPDAVKKLALHKFGPLTPMVNNLSKRLSLHINAVDAWKHFSAEASSNLIKRFGQMYTECALNGAKPEETSLFISNNMFKILAIRKKKHVVSSSFLGVLYGVMVALAFTLYVTIGIAEYMSDIISKLVLANQGFMTSGFLNTIFNSDFSIEPLMNMAFAVILLHALFSSLMLPLLRGGHLAGAAIHFIVMLWLASAAQLAVDLMLSGLLGI